MKAATLRAFLALHTWVGLVAGAALFIAFYAGAVTVFEHELQHWFERPAAVQDDATQRAQDLLDAVVATHPAAAHDLSLQLPGEHGTEPVVYWYEQPAGADPVNHRFTLDADGTLHDGPRHDGFIGVIYDLHFTAGLPRTIGIYSFGVICILYGLALVSGVVIYAPTFFKDLFALRWGHNLKRLWQDAHNVIGLLSLPFHVIFAWSGAVLTIGFIMLAPFQFLVFDGKLLEILDADFEVTPHVASAQVAAPTLSVAALVERARAASPGLEVEFVSFHDIGDANARVVAYGDNPQQRLDSRGAVALDGASGAVLRVVEPATLSPGSAFLRGIQAVHYGNFGHAPVKWLYFLLGLAGAFLFYSGNLLWVEARRRRRELAQPRRTRVMAQLTIGVCIGCIVGVSALFHVGVLWPGLEHEKYVGVFLACVAWALLRAPARGAVELLGAAALLSVTIPLLPLAAGTPSLPVALWQGDWTRALVDVTAIVLGIGYALLARATLRRARHGEPNSVWALHTARP